MTALVIVLAAAGWLLVAHAALDAVLLRRPPGQAEVDEPVSLLLPVRDEAARVEPCLRALLAQRGLADAELLVLDDGSTDGTADVVRRVAGDRATLLTGDPPPSGWLGKPHACHGLAAAARGDVLVFVDADVVLAADAVARAVGQLRRDGWALSSPYPRQLTGSWLELLVQPLLQWSWLTFLPLRLAERSPRPSLSAANGQLLVVDAAAYHRAGGHAAVRGEVVEDVALVRAVKAAGGRGGVSDGTRLATCRMYDGPRALADGYAKSLWTAFGSPAGGLAVAALLLALYLLPWLLVAATPAAWAAAAAGPAGRLVTDLRVGTRPRWAWLLQPLSVLAFATLVVVSVARRRRGTLAWKGRALR